VKSVKLRARKVASLPLTSSATDSTSSLCEEGAVCLASEGIVPLGVTLCVCPPSRSEGTALRLECF